MRIGISVDPGAVHGAGANSAWQCAAFLARALQALPQVDGVVLFCARAMAVAPPAIAAPAFAWRPQHEVGDHVDVIIDVAGACDASWLALQRARGRKVVLYVVSQPYAERVEPAVFDRPSMVRPPARFDEVWMPSAFAAFASIERVLARCPVHVVPYLWHPCFAAHRAAALGPTHRTFGWRQAPRSEGWRIAIFEANRSVSASASIPLLVCDEAARAQPGCVQRLNVLNSLHLVQHPTLMFLANSLDLVRQHRTVFLADADLVDFMPGQADAVVSHQWLDAQSAQHLEALWGDYPLVHNSPWLHAFGLGYYYPGFDAAEGGRQLRRALAVHADNAVRDRLRAQALFEAVDPEAPHNRNAFAHRLEVLRGDAAQGVPA